MAYVGHSGYFCECSNLCFCQWKRNSSTLQNAILQASNDSEIWVKMGTYLISERLELTRTGVKLFWGFEGNETNLNQPDWENHLTIFDGQSTVQIMQYDSDNGVIDGIQFVNGM